MMISQIGTPRIHREERVPSHILLIKTGRNTSAKHCVVVAMVAALHRRPSRRPRRRPRGRSGQEGREDGGLARSLGGLGGLGLGILDDLEDLVNASRRLVRRQARVLRDELTQIILVIGRDAGRGACHENSAGLGADIGRAASVGWGCRSYGQPETARR